MEPQIHAWVQVQPEPALSAGPLSAIPFGAKDIIETKGLSTEYGSPIYKGRIGTTDAAIVRQIRQRGGILVGKTQTVAFAFRDPAPTRNPRDVAHTPGGSSSGSAAAVAAGTMPVTIGTQTGGSVLRPASFCGVTGFKASYGLLPMEGVLPLAKSLDTLGFFTHTPSDMLAFWEAMGQSTGREEHFPIAAPEPVPPVDPAMRVAFDDAILRLGRAGFKIQRIDIAAMLEKLTAANRTLMYYEGARVHRERFDQYGDRLGAVADLVREGSRLSDNEYRDALTYIRECKAKVRELYKVTPVILVPAAPGPAPLGLASTGDSRMNAPWTTLGTPAVSIPMPVGSALPLGLQLTANHGEDARVIRTAITVERIFKRSG
jgi:amidase